MTVQLAHEAAVVFAVDRTARKITGLILPYGQIGEIPSGPAAGKYRFARGQATLPADLSRVKLVINHAVTNAREVIGYLESTEETDAGLMGTFAVGRSAAADEALINAEDRVWDGLSAGFAPGARFALRGGVYEPVNAPIREVSVTPLPIFTDARVTGVAASAAVDHKEESMPEQDPAKTPPATPPATDPANPPVTFSEKAAAEFGAQLAELKTKIDGLADIKVPVPTAQFSVKEEPIYRFGGSIAAPSGHDFAMDMLAAVRDGDRAALDRLSKFTTEAAEAGPSFATTADVDAINPTEYRADMFLGQAPTPRSPLYDAFHKGSLSSVRPFTYSILDRTATNAAVNTHTEGNNPAATNVVTTTAATVEPGAMSGRVHITREVADLGGTPNYSGLVWLALERSFAIQREQRTAALLAAIAAPTALNPTAIAAGATGAVAGANIKRGLVGLQFIPEGGMFDHVFGQQDLYQALADAVTTTGEELYPQRNPTNRSGQAASRWRTLDIGGYEMEPTWSLGASSANASKSWVASSAAVHVFASGLQRLDKLSETVEGWDLGVWAYFGGVVWDSSLLRVISYDPTA